MSSDIQIYDNSYLSITHVNERRVVVGLEELEVEEFAVEEKPRAAHGGRDGGTAHVICRQGRLHARHEQGRQLNSTRHDVRQLEGNTTT